MSDAENHNQNDDGVVINVDDDERMKQEHDRLVAKYGKSLSKTMLKKKLNKKRHFFDSADYFRRLEKGEQEINGDEKSRPILYCFKRKGTSFEADDSSSLDVKEMLKKNLSKGGKHHFDSADWCLKLEGLLEYPLGETPHPVMFYFNQDQVGVLSHPGAARAPESTLREMCEAADEELRRRYGDKLTSNQMLRLKLRGKKGTKKFDSAEWALSLQGAEPTE